MKKFSVVLLNADSVPDSLGHIHSKRQTKLIKKSVPVTREYGGHPSDFLGKATLRWEGTAVIADVTIADPNELLDILYPCATGTFTGKNTKKGMGCSIKGVGLLSRPKYRPSHQNCSRTN